LRFNLGSDFFPILSTPIGTCTPTDNLAAQVRMHVLDGDALITTTQGQGTVSLDCLSSVPTPVCGRLGWRSLEVELDDASPPVIPFLYSANFCPFLGRVDYTGTLRFSGTLRGHVTRILAGPVRDPNPGCP
jgi:hypothetical protein